MNTAVFTEAMKEAVKEAAETGRYEPVLVVILVGVMVLGLCWVIRYMLAQQERERVRQAEAYERQITALREELVRQATVSAAREDRMAKRIDELEAFQRAEMKNLAEAARESLDNNTQAIAANTQAIGDMRDTLHDRPCLRVEPSNG